MAVGKTSVVVLIWGLGLAVSNLDDGIVPEDWQAPPQATELAAAVGSQYRVQVRRPETVVGDTSGEGEIIDMASATGKYDAGFVCQQHSLESLLGADKWAVDAHLVQIDPILSKSERFGSIVHHMDIFACTSDVHSEAAALHTRAQQSDWCSSDVFLQSSCKQLMWAYDRGAETFKMPEEAAILIGPSAGFDHILFQTHYLLPLDYVVGKDSPIRDSSGFELVFDTKLRPHDSGLFGFLDCSISLPPNRQDFVFRNHINSQTLANMIAADLLEFGKVTPFAVHLHAHGHATAVVLEHYRGEQKLRTYDSIIPFHGYGKDQTFKHLPADAEPILAGDSLTFACTYSTTSAEQAIHYGVSHGDEMCGPVVLYYPHARGMNGYNVVNMHEGGSQSRDEDTSAADVMQQLKHPSGHPTDLQAAMQMHMHG